MSKIKRNIPKLIVAGSEQDPDMLYATKFWAPDPFIFLQRNGKRTLVLSDLEIDRARKQGLNGGRPGIKRFPLNPCVRTHVLFEPAIGFADHGLRMREVGKRAYANHHGLRI